MSSISEEWDLVHNRRFGPFADVLAFVIRRARAAVELMLAMTRLRPARQATTC